MIKVKWKRFQLDNLKENFKDLQEPRHLGGYCSERKDGSDLERDGMERWKEKILAETVSLRAWILRTQRKKRRG